MNAYDPHLLTNEEYMEVFDEPSPLAKKQDGEQAQQTSKEKKKTISNIQSSVNELTEDEKLELIETLMEKYE